MLEHHEIVKFDIFKDSNERQFVRQKLVAMKSDLVDVRKPK